MKCFIIAMEKEAAPVIDAMEIARDAKICNKRVICGALYGEKVALIVCGVGKVNAACAAQYAISCLGADELINLGVAGGLNEGVSVGGVYSVNAAVQYDFDLTQLNKTEIGTLDGYADNYITVHACNAYACKKLATADRFNDSVDDYNLLTKTLAADLRDMEGGAVAQVCFEANVTCKIFKIVSDSAGKGSTPAQYKANFDLCMETLKRELQTICHAE